MVGTAQFLTRAALVSVVVAGLELLAVLRLDPVARSGHALGLFAALFCLAALLAVPLAALLFALTRAGLRVPIPRGPRVVSVAFGAAVAAVGTRLADRWFDDRDVDFLAEYVLVRDNATALIILSAFVLATLLDPVIAAALRRVRGGESPVAVLGVTLSVVALWLISFAPAPMAMVGHHSFKSTIVLAIGLCPATLAAQLLWPSPGPRARRLAGIIAGVLVVGALTLGRSAGPAYLLFTRPPTLRPLALAIGAALDFDDDGTAGFPGPDCAAFDKERAPGAHASAGDADADCDGEPSPPAPAERTPARTWRGCDEAVVPERPSFVLLSIDTLRADVLTPDRTPAIHRLAQRSAWFTSARSPSTHTGASIPAIFTGLAPSDTVTGVLGRSSVRAALPTIASQLSTAGWETRFVSHFSISDALRHGFAERLSTDDDDRRPKGVKHSFLSADLTDAAVKYLATTTPERPFLLWAHYSDLHAAHLPTDGGPTDGSLWRPHSMKRRYEMEAAYVDHHVGRLLDSLAGSSVAANTVVVLFSDHGEGLGERGLVGHGYDPSEPVVHVPLGVYVPGCPSLQVRAPVSVGDVADTVRALAALPTTGFSLADAVREIVRPLPVVVETGYDGALRRAVYQDSHKLIVDESHGGSVLFDLAQDPNEHHDLGGDDELRQKLESAYRRWRSRPSLRR